MNRRKQAAAGLALLALVSNLCLAGLKAIDRKIAGKEGKRT